MVKSEKSEKFEKSEGWDRKSVHPPIFGRENLRNPKLWHRVEVASELPMDPMNVIASDPQM